MLNRVFPQRFDNNYRGHKLALWLFIPIVLMKVGISLSSIFDTYNVVRSADGIPMDAFTPPWRGGGRFGNHAFGPFPVLARLAWCAGIGSLPCDDSAYVCPALGGISCQKMDSTCETHRKDRDITQHLRKPGAHRAADRGPCSVAPN